LTSTCHRLPDLSFDRAARQDRYSADLRSTHVAQALSGPGSRPIVRDCPPFSLAKMVGHWRRAQLRTGLEVRCDVVAHALQVASEIGLPIATSPARQLLGVPSHPDPRDAAQISSGVPIASSPNPPRRPRTAGEGTVTSVAGVERVASGDRPVTENAAEVTFRYATGRTTRNLLGQAGNQPEGGTGR
jgi:hypothetical protein